MQGLADPFPLGKPKSLFAECILGKKCYLGTFYGVFTISPCASVITANVLTGMWGRSGKVLFLSVHSLSPLDSSVEQRVWGRREKNENRGEREQNRQMTENKWREEMQPESLEREAPNNHSNMWAKFLF